MSEGQGSISYSKRSSGAVPPFVNVAGARNGTSLDAASFVVLGQDVGEAGNPAKLTSNRQIPLEGNAIEFLRSNSEVIEIADDGIHVFMAFPAEASMTDAGIILNASPAASIAAGPVVGVFNDTDDGFLYMMLIPPSLGLGNGVMIIGDTSIVRTLMLWYQNGGVGLGASDFHNNGNETGLSIDGAITGQKMPVIKTAPYTLDNRFDSGKVFTNSGVGAIVEFTLPEAATLAGSGYFDFYVDEAVGVQINASATDTIQVGPAVSAGGGSTTSTVKGSALRLLLLDPGANPAKWVAMSVVGTWVTV
jgi:hypothetical protein